MELLLEPTMELLELTMELMTELLELTMELMTELLLELLLDVSYVFSTIVTFQCWVSFALDGLLDKFAKTKNSAVVFRGPEALTQNTRLPNSDKPIVMFWGLV
jgi:hypothetical protein